jgi:hypothetical protein
LDLGVALEELEAASLPGERDRGREEGAEGGGTGYLEHGWMRRGARAQAGVRHGARGFLSRRL